ncbi:MAG: pyruvate dehydrogenase complex dihydrolipoamide acetyltransferase [Bacteroidia bacterium]|nr:pyruvate dehydrogenase complex dihydrolipoamide acetyltransferase [Bacteroidia bacterium]MCF8425812.1 pyruvate dehydrogenase complex dihydrolipoamide acetyltransferase [Bacteroidia bacterium]
MAEVINMPKMSDTMTEGVIVSWLKNVGEEVKPGDILAEVETDKATMELENFVKGTLLHIGIPAGGSVPVDALIAIVGQKGEDITALISGAAAPKAAASAPEAPAHVDAPVVEETPVASASDNGRVKASPLAKSIAKEKGIDLNAVAGSGDNGRIVKKDIENFVPATTASASKAAAPVSLPQIVAQESYTEVPVSQMRKAIARRLSESKHTAPHFYLTMSINMDKVIAARKQMNEYSEVKISVNDIIIKAVAASLRKNPNANSSWLGDKIRYNQHINIGVAVAIEDGLIVPVVKFADNKSISHISAEVKQLADKAKNKKLQPNEFEGNTFTISNLGMFGIDEFTAIINPPDACILAVGAAKETVVAENGQMKIAQVMKVTLSCDHRVVDGAVGSAFLGTLKDLLENPVKMLV